MCKFLRDVTEMVGVISPSSKRLRRSTTGVVFVLSASFLAIFFGELCRVPDACRLRLMSRLWDLVRGGVGVHRGVGGSLIDTCRAICLVWALNDCFTDDQSPVRGACHLSQGVAVPQRGACH